MSFLTSNRCWPKNTLDVLCALHNSEFRFFSKPGNGSQTLWRIASDYWTQLIHCMWICKYNKLRLCVAGTLPIVGNNTNVHLLWAIVWERKTKELAANVMYCLFYWRYNPFQWIHLTYIYCIHFSYIRTYGKHISDMQHHQIVCFSTHTCIYWSSAEMSPLQSILRAMNVK